MLAIRSTVTRIFFRMLSDTTISKADADAVTRAYIRRFVELSMFNRYLPAMLGFLGTRKAVRKDAYFKLREYGIDMATRTELPRLLLESLDQAAYIAV